MLECPTFDIETDQFFFFYCSIEVCKQYMSIGSIKNNSYEEWSVNKRVVWESQYTSAVDLFQCFASLNTPSFYLVMIKTIFQTHFQKPPHSLFQHLLKESRTSQSHFKQCAMQKPNKALQTSAMFDVCNVVYHKVIPRLNVIQHNYVQFFTFFFVVCFFAGFCDCYTLL